VTLFDDTLFIHNKDSGELIQASLDGRRSFLLARIPEKDVLGVTASASAVFVTHSQGNFISGIPWKKSCLFWSPQNHKKIDSGTKKLIRLVVVASLAPRAHSNG
jgi:hypothetical protein